MQISQINQYNRTINFKGWTPRKAINKEKIEQINNLFKDSEIKRISVSGHTCPDADSIGACYATAYLLNKKTGQKVDVYIFGTVPEKYKYLEDENIMNVIELGKNPKYLMIQPKQYDLAVSVDTSNTLLMDMDYYRNVFSKAKHTVKLDHHKLPENINPKDSKQIFFADINLTDSNTASASELVMQLTKPLGIQPQQLPEAYNNSVYTGIIGDTGNFNFAKTSLPFYDTVLLINNGLKPNYVSQKMNVKLSKEGIDVIDKSRNRIQYSKTGNIAYLYVDKELKDEINSLPEDANIEVKNRIKRIVSKLIDVKDVDVSLLITKKEPDTLLISARSSSVNIRKFAQKYGGGGHDYAAGFSVKVPKQDEYTIKNILKDLQKTIDQNKNES